MPYKRKGSPYWWCSVTPPGGGTKIRFSSKTADRAEAEAIEGRTRAEMFRQSVWKEEPERSFEEVAAAFLATSKRKRSFADIQMRVRHLNRFFSGYCMNDLRVRDVRAYISFRQDEGVSDSTINRETAVLSAALVYCTVQLEWNLPNPAKGQKLKEPEGRVRWITRAEAARLIQIAESMKNGRHLSDFIQLALNTGCRKNELLKLEWRRVDFGHNLVTLEPEDNKSAKRRTIPLNDTAVAALLRRKAFVSEHCPSSPWVFCNSHGNRSVEPRTGFKTACDRAGITNFRIHDLRHTCASWMVSEGVPLADVKEVLGHSTIKMTEKYAHLAPHRAREAVNRLQAQSGHIGRPSKVVGTIKNKTNHR
ncbi:tyrosine-type recombinase/integrase [Carnimonas bestiolae]|uniref:tyrosine-type recombinase/integrase n=1 Tax=Carnimonas bestiolae TaxID=3402172 RepID=UPI003EDB7E2A